MATRAEGFRAGMGDGEIVDGRSSAGTGDHLVYGIERDNRCSVD